MFRCRKENSQSLTDFLKYLPKNLTLLVQKLWRKKYCQNPFPAILGRKKVFKKVLLSTKSGGGAKGLSGLSTKKKNCFCGFPKG